MTRLTVVTVSHESSGILGAFLERLDVGREDGDRVVVVDSGSRDAEGSRTVAERQGAIFTMVASNVGFGTASNIGTVAAETEFLAFVNPDVDTSFADLRVLALEAKRTGAACVGPRVRDASGEYARAERGTIVAPWKRRHETVRDEGKHIESIAGCCMVLPTTWFEAVGGFDPFFFMFTEEIDLHRRITQAGGAIRVVDSVTVVTEGGGSSAEVGSRWSVTERDVGHVRYVWKWFGLPAALVDLVWRTASIVVKRDHWPIRLSLTQLFRGVLSREAHQRRDVAREYGVLPWD